MKSLRFITASVALAVVTTITASAQTAPGRQQPAATPRPAPATGASTAPATPPSLTGKIAIIDSGYFTDEKEGIARVVNAMKGIAAQFQPQQTELEQMKSRYDALLADIQKTSIVASPQSIATKTDQAEQLKRDMERKAQDAQAAVERRQREVMTPLQEDVFNALQAYAQARGIAVVIDMNRVPVLVVADSVNITRDFITEYNRTHPATTAAAGRP
ncbi:MAG: OmpH family outer membrane protein [Acidobacteria bacterium]|nr:OmpH family outer membrane protein [Acidobacteriota bacterium]MCA1636316.1 OmpH family outer membrane protein [Acidobacteriota bacterium]